MMKDVAQHNRGTFAKPSIEIFFKRELEPDKDLKGLQKNRRLEKVVFIRVNSVLRPKFAKRFYTVKSYPQSVIYPRNPSNGEKMGRRYLNNF